MYYKLALVALTCAFMLTYGCQRSVTPEPREQYVPLAGPVTNGGNTTFVMEVEIGTPPQKVPLAFDTGSAGLIVNAPSCELCGSAPRTFDAARSTTWETLACDAPECEVPDCSIPQRCEAPYGCSHCYAGTNACQWCGFYYNNFFQILGYWGPWGNDVVNVGNVSVRLGMGRALHALNANSSFGGYTSGIFGMDLPGSSRYLAARNETPTFTSVAGPPNGKGLPFSICLTNDGGKLLLGAPDRRHMAGPLHRLDLLGPPNPQAQFLAGEFVVPIEGMTVGSTPVAADTSAYYSNPVAFDAGTGTWELPNSIYQPLMNNMCNSSSDVARCENVVAGLAGNCMALTDGDIELLPPIHSTFSGTTFTVEPRGYLFEGALGAIALAGKECRPGEFTLSISGAPSQGVSLFGFAFMRHFTLYYDGQNRQVGLAKQKACMKPS
jgi:hypothetical protein